MMTAMIITSKSAARSGTSGMMDRNAAMTTSTRDGIMIERISITSMIVMRKSIGGMTKRSAAMITMVTRSLDGEEIADFSGDYLGRRGLEIGNGLIGKTLLS
jgi:hypothetical protein